MSILETCFKWTLGFSIVSAIMAIILFVIDTEIAHKILGIISAVFFISFIILFACYESHNDWKEVKKYTEKAVITDMYTKQHSKTRYYGKFIKYYTIQEYYIVTETAKGEEDTWKVSERSYDNVEEGQEVYVVTHYYETEYTHDTYTEKTWWYD